VVTAPRLEADLKQRTAEAIEAAGGDPSKFEIAGRDVTLPEDAPKRQALIDAVLNVEGVRLVAGIEQPKPPKAEPKEPASAERQTEAAPAAGDETARTETKTDIAPSGDAAAEKPPVEPKIEAGAAPKEANAPKEAVKKATSQQRQEPPAPQPELQPSPPAEQIPLREPLVAVIPPAPSDPEAMKSVAAETPPVAKLGPGELDAASCQAAISSALGKDKIQFGEGSAKIRFVSTPLLDKIAALLKRCPSTKFEIAVHTDAPGAANETMTQRRAERLVEYFEREGVARGRLIGVGYGAKKPLRPNKGESDRAANRRVEFLAK
jgi:outer membrane protein OmpA-like peptidoglycan-associated protein